MVLLNIIYFGIQHTTVHKQYTVCISESQLDATRPIQYSQPNDDNEIQPIARFLDDQCSLQEKFINS